MTQNQVALYRAALKEARASFDQATSRRNQIALEDFTLNKEIARLRRTITALAAMCSESPFEDDLGITEACIEVMEIQKTAVSTADVVKALEDRGYDLAPQKNASASVHAILSRLAKRGKIEKITEEDGNGVMWKGPNFDPNEVPF